MPSQAKGKTVLVVEHEPQLLGMAVTILKRAGFAVLWAMSAEAALRVAADCAGPIHLLLASYTLPDLSGPELAASFERRRPGTPIMLMSGYPEVRALAAGYGWYYTPKPFVPCVFLDLVKAAAAGGNGAKAA